MIALANGLPLPKAGVIAAAQGDRVADAVAADVRSDRAPPPFDGRRFCFLETGLREAAVMAGDFYAEPEPAVRLAEPSSERHPEKAAFEGDRLAAWFGR